jgi:amino acid transporter
VIGLFFVLTTYAGDVFYGPDKDVSFGALGGGSPWIQLARDAWGVGWVLAFFAILNSTFANGNAGTLATTRTWYAMARIGVLPSPLARTHPQWKSPYVGVCVQLVLTLAIGLPIGLHFGPVTGFVFLATTRPGRVVISRESQPDAGAPVARQMPASRPQHRGAGSRRGSKRTHIRVLESAVEVVTLTF